MRTLLQIFIFLTLTGFASSIVLVAMGESIWILAFGIVGGATTVMYYQQYKHLYPKDIATLKQVLSMLGASASHAIHR